MLDVHGTTPRATVRERWVVCVLFAVWIAHLLAYVSLVPPWQHYDEPTHFEYAALIRELGRFPLAGEYIPELRRTIASSMIETGFYANGSASLTPPNLDSPNVSLGIDERGHPPLYYALVALATLPVRDAPITTQLYAARLLSVLVAGLLFVVSYFVLRLLPGVDPQLRCAILAVLALQPAFADIMSAVNSDVLANLVAVLCLLAGVWFLRRPGWQRLLVGVAVLLLALNVKRVLLLYALILPCAWFLALSPRLRRRLLLTACIGAIGTSSWLLLQPWQLAEWSVTPSTASGYVSTRLVQRPQQPAYMSVTPYTGAVAFALETRSGEPPPTLSQSLYPTQLQTLSGKRLTLAAWMRADRSMLPASTPIMLVDHNVFSRIVQLGTDWQLVVQTVNVPQQVGLLEVQLPGPIAPGIIWYDSVALVEGGTANLPKPDEADASFEAGLLGEQAPRNLLRNVGAERQIPPLPDLVQRFSGGLLNEAGMRGVLGKLFDPGWIAVVYPRQALLLFQGFWGVFGWGERSVSLGWFTPLGILVIASLLGAARLTWCGYWPHRAGATRVRTWWLCLFGVIMGWGMAMLRVHSQPFPGVMFWSFGRYAFVALLPSLLVFVAGLRALLPKELRLQGLIGVISFLLIYALAALLGTMSAYAR